MSDYYNLRIYELDFKELLDSVIIESLIGQLSNSYINDEDLVQLLDFSLLEGFLHADARISDFFNLDLSQVITFDSFPDLTLEQQSEILDLAVEISVGTIVPRAAITNSLKWASPIDLLGEDFYQNTLEQARENRENESFTSANDLLFGQDGEQSIRGGDGDDWLTGEAGSDKLYGEDGSDFIMGGDDRDLVSGGDGDDWLGGMKGNDIIIGGDGDDWIEGGRGNDEAYAGSGDDMLHGNEGDDYLSSGSGNDVLNGSDGQDTLVGGNQTDTLLGGTGDDILYGEYYVAGYGWDYDNVRDIFVFSHGDGNDIVKDFGYGHDLLDLRAFNFTSIEEALSFASQNGTDVVFTFTLGEIVSTITLENTEIENLDETNIWINGEAPEVISQTETVFVGTADDDTWEGQAGDSEAYGSDGNDSLSGNGGSDLIYGERGADFLEGDDGDDRLFGGSENDVLDGGRDNDFLYGQEGDDALYGDEGSDYLLGGEGADVLSGGDGYDYAAYWTNGSAININLQDRSQDTGDAVGDLYIDIEEFVLTNFDDTFVGDENQNRVRGLEGNDSLMGAGGNDHLSGNEGDDLINGGTGDDFLFGGEGSDEFVFAGNDGQDTIFDFSIEDDLLNLFETGVTGFDDLEMSYDGIHTTINYGSGEIILRETDIAQVEESSFLFA